MKVCKVILKVIAACVVAMVIASLGIAEKACCCNVFAEANAGVNFIGSCKNGSGIIKYTNGDFYMGGIANGQKERWGRMIYANDGGVYVGQWKNDKKNGMGSILANGSRYCGHWKDNIEIDRIAGDGFSTFGACCCCDECNDDRACERCVRTSVHAGAECGCFACELAGRVCGSVGDAVIALGCGGCCIGIACCCLPCICADRCCFDEEDARLNAGINGDLDDWQ